MTKTPSKNKTPKPARAERAGKPEGQAATKPQRSEPDEPREPTKLSFEGVLAREEAATYFEALISGLRKGQIRFRRSNESLLLAPSAQVHVEVKASRKTGKEKLAFEMSWSTPTDHDLQID
jgi:amphi-Trp domain-containing protein